MPSAVSRDEIGAEPLLLLAHKAADARWLAGRPGTQSPRWRRTSATWTPTPTWCASGCRTSRRACAASTEARPSPSPPLLARPLCARHLPPRRCCHCCAAECARRRCDCSAPPRHCHINIGRFSHPACRVRSRGRRAGVQLGTQSRYLFGGTPLAARDALLRGAPVGHVRNACTRGARMGRTHLHAPELLLPQRGELALRVVAATLLRADVCCHAEPRVAAQVCPHLDLHGLDNLLQAVAAPLLGGELLQSR
jgi:hypothetical protein